MPKNEHLVLCGGVGGDESSLKLDLHGASANVRLHISDISRRLLTGIPDVLIDLLEVASYIYAADSAIPRGGDVGGQMGKAWRRNFRFIIPVRRPKQWSSGPIASALVETLSFLSDHNYELEFRSLVGPPPMRSYFEFADAEGGAFTPDEVVLFSGGMDSFAGAIEEIAVRGNSVALVSHRSASKIAATQKRLVDQLRKRFGAGRVLHLPVWAHVDSSLNREPTHRTRSFLFAALGTVTATLFGRASIRIYENGVVSLNLPPVAQVIGARATRTTHPQVLAGFRRFLSELLGRCFDVENPFAWLTKAEVVRRISGNDCGDLLRDTRSCTRVREMTLLHPHCGQCSQCIDRRFAVLVAEQEHEDPAEAYKVELFFGERPAGPDREMVLAFVRSATRINQMADIAFFAHYGETSRIVGYFDEPADTVAERILDLHRRHAFGICRIFDQAISHHASALREGSLPSDCLLSLIVGQHGPLSGYLISRREPERFATDIEIRIAVDEKRKRVMFDGWGELTGKNAELLIVLAAPFRQATRNELAPENFPFISAATLRQQTNCPNEDAFRRRILRCRNSIAKLAGTAGNAPLSTEAVIESIPWRGYRLNPDRVRIVARSEICSSK